MNRWSPEHVGVDSAGIAAILGASPPAKGFGLGILGRGQDGIWMASFKVTFEGS